MARERFDHKAIEKSAQEKWDALKLYECDLTDTTKEPYYLLFEFPYPSGDLHIGHWYAYAITDIYARLMRMRGKNVLFPIGFDSFGLPAENAAMKHGANPKEWTYQNIERMRSQIRTIGASLDWSKEVVTSDASYYRFTQWLFGKLFEQKLAYRGEASVKWCPKDMTVLANEQVVDGKCERCDSEVEEKKLTQWFMKITDYAERLLTDLEGLSWPEEIKEAQRAWIGKSEGARLRFTISGTDKEVEVFTTRPDTIFGATYLVLAPDHAVTADIVSLAGNMAEVQKYISSAAKKTERERSENKEKTGVQLEGVSAINPATKEEIPVYVADYVLASYGTGAVMAVPSHDERDYEFAKKYNLPMTEVVEPLFYATTGPDTVREDLPFVERDAIVAVLEHWSEKKYLILKWKKVAWYTFITGGIEKGQTAEEAALSEIREETGFQSAALVRDYGTLHSKFYHPPKGENRYGHFRCMHFKLKDETRSEIDASENDKHELIWMTAEEARKVLTPAAHELLAERMFDENLCFGGDGVLVNSGAFNGKGNREAMNDIIAHCEGERTTNYRIRDWLVSRQRYWGCPIPIVYDPEGTPHLVPEEHLPWLLPEDVSFASGESSPLASSRELHERVTRIFGEGWTPEYDTLDTFVDSSWYFMRYLDSKDEHNFSDHELMKKWMPIDRYSGGSEHTTMHLLYARFFTKALYDLALSPVSEPFSERFNRGLVLGPDGQKMSKRWGNIVNPDEMVEKYGADAVRMNLAFIGPYNEPGHYPWKLDGVEAMRKFLERAYALKEKVSDVAVSMELERSLAKAEAKVKIDSDRFKFNTALSALMILLKDLEELPEVPRTAYRSFILLLAPFAPHLAEHMWEGVSFEGSVHATAWPEYDPALLTEEEATVVVQVNSKRRGEVRLRKDASEQDALAALGSIPGVAETVSAGGFRVVYVPGRIINIIKSKA